MANFGPKEKTKMTGDWTRYGTLASSQSATKPVQREKALTREQQTF